MNRRVFRWLGISVLSMGFALAAHAAPWFPLGPWGGDARSFAADPQNSQHLFMGSATGYLYESIDGGANWKRLSMVGKRDDLVLDHIVVDSVNPKHLIVGAWVLDHPDGGLYESTDGGMTWYAQAEMRGQSVRSMAVAPSDPKIIVAGTLKGVYRSEDAGIHWHLISPEGSSEIHEIESVAIDPVDPRIIYAGTWHLPWKTLDGGAHWVSIKDGILDDSDVFSIIVDSRTPRTVYASACSGIYKSLNSGLHFERVRKEQLGMDHAALRTRKLQQDPTRPRIVFAGTTQGLWRTTDDAATWKQMTSSSVIVNDVYVDPKNADHVLLATDRGGVLTSDDGGLTFKPTNTGFSARQVTSFASDPKQPSTVYVGVVNDKEAGGVFMSHDGGVTWQQESNSLGGRDVFSLGNANDGTLLAGTSHGIFRLQDGLWSPSGAFTLTNPPVPPVVETPKPVARKTVAGARAGVRKPVVKPELPPPPSQLDAVVYAIVQSGDALFAGTSKGLVKGTPDGLQWKDVPTLQMPETHFLAAEKGIVMAATLRRIAISVDGGNKWDVATVPDAITQISTIAVDEAGNLWVGGREGAFYSTDYGMTWKTLRNLYVTQVTGIYFDKPRHRVMVTTNGSFNTISFAVNLPDYRVTYWDSGWNLRFVRPAGDHLIGATLYDGMVVQPIMVDSAVKASR